MRRLVTGRVLHRAPQRNARVDFSYHVFMIAQDGETNFLMPPASASGARPDARRKITHEQVLAAAARQMNRRGVAATLLKDVAAELGVTRMALYRYARDREDLVAQCYLRTCEVLEARLAEAAEREADASKAVALFFELTLSEGEPEVCAIVEQGLLPPERRDEVNARYDALATRLAALLADGAARGELRAMDAEVAAHSILNVVFWAPVADFWNVVKLDGERALMLELTQDFVFHGWAADRRQVPDYPPLDLSVLDKPIEAFDRAGLAEARREKILTVASRLFSEKGVDSTTLDDVASELGATSGAISHNVGDKPTLAAECYLRTLRTAIVLQAESNALPCAGLNANAAFRHAWALTQMRRWVLTPLAGFEGLPPAGRQAFHELVEPLTKLTLDQVAQGIADGSMRPLHRYATRLQAGVIGWVARSGVRDPVRQDAIAREIAALVAVGIKPLG
jgi:AcrR family transcriptional regulator